MSHTGVSFAISQLLVFLSSFEPPAGVENSLPCEMARSGRRQAGFWVLHIEPKPASVGQSGGAKTLRAEVRVHLNTGTRSFLSESFPLHEAFTHNPPHVTQHLSDGGGGGGEGITINSKVWGLHSGHSWTHVVSCK